MAILLWAKGGRLTLWGYLDLFFADVLIVIYVSLLDAKVRYR